MTWPPNCTLPSPPSLPVGGTYDENCLLVGHAIHLCEDLVDDTVSCTSAVSCTATTGLGDGIQLIEEEDAGSSLPGLGDARYQCELDDGEEMGLARVASRAQRLHVYPV